MKTNDFFEAQKKLDERIIKEHPEIEGQDLIKEKVLALIMELGELMNELPGDFKFWSNKPNDREKALKEYVDLFHFTLSIGNDIGVNDYNFENVFNHGKGLFDEFQVRSIKSLMIEYTHSLIYFEIDPDPENYYTICRYFLAIGKHLDLSWAEIHHEYFKKNEINHKRQDEKY